MKSRYSYFLGALFAEHIHFMPGLVTPEPGNVDHQGFYAVSPAAVDMERFTFPTTSWGFPRQLCYAAWGDSSMAFIPPATSNATRSDRWIWFLLHRPSDSLPSLGEAFQIFFHQHVVFNSVSELQGSARQSVGARNRQLTRDSPGAPTSTLCCSHGLAISLGNTRSPGIYQCRASLEWWRRWWPKRKYSYNLGRPEIRGAEGV
jgi:hypothetical protein